MNANRWKGIGLSSVQPLVDAFAAPQWKTTLILLTSTVLMLVWSYFASPQFLADRFTAGGGDGRMAGAIGNFVGCVVLLGLMPALVIRLILRERLADYGIGWGVPRRTWGAIAALLPAFFLVAYLARTDATLLSKFPINPRAGESAAMFALHAATYLLFYVGWEFHFRGYLLFGLRPAIGASNAVLLQTMASSLLHIGSPAAETFGAILAGVLWGVLALWTRSLMPSLVQHFLLGLALDAFICFAR